MKTMADVDVVVIGAGAAGLAAARRLRAADRSTVVLEARNRVGGRAWTETDSFGFPLDRGCHWLHSADVNPLRPIAQELGLGVVELDRDRSRRTEGSSLSADEMAECTAAVADFFDLASAAGRAGRDVAVADVVPSDSRWRSIFDAIMTWSASVEVDAISTLDYATYRDTGKDWPVRDGLGTVIARHGADVPVTLGAPVEAVDWRGGAVVVSCSAGMVRSDAVVITVPTSVLAAGAIRFDPPLPSATVAAFENLPLGTADKVDLLLDESGTAMLPADTYRIGRIDTSRTNSLWIRHLGRPTVTGFLGGNLARDLEAAGEAAAIAFVTDELASHFGQDIRRCIRKGVASAWGTDPYTLGGYSCARPGHAHRRADLAAPVDGRLFFAGEATSIDAYSTAHGAHLSGLRAADEVLAAWPAARSSIA
jgi:monoamine oxidase